MTARTLALGPLMLDVAGTELTADDRRRLLHPLVGGVILFTRNYSNPGQLMRLTDDIHALRNPPLLVAVDHEGGRVQRFREGFTAIPPMRELGRVWDTNPQQARQFASEAAFVLAAELRAHGVDLTFAPVLDVDHGNSSVIGDRALHSEPRAVAEVPALEHGVPRGAPERRVDRGGHAADPDVRPPRPGRDDHCVYRPGQPRRSAAWQHRLPDNFCRRADAAVDNTGFQRRGVQLAPPVARR